MPIWDIFKKSHEDPVEKKVDPIVEQRRKEKFSTPLIYSEDKQKLQEENNTGSVATATKKVNKPIKPKTDTTANSNYRMSEIISPFYGRKEEPVKTKSKQSTPKKVQKRKPIEDQIVPVISPIFGANSMFVEEEEEIEEVTLQLEEEPMVIEKEPTATTKQQKTEQKVDTKKDTASFDLEDILKKENDNLEDVKKRTGEIQLDILNTSSSNSKTEDEIDDAMTLDELMSLYERKFKDGEDE